MSVTFKEETGDKKLPKPGRRTKARAEEAVQRNAQRPVSASLKLAADEITSIGPPHSDLAGWCGTMLDALGTASENFMAAELGRVMDAIREPNQKVAGEIETNGALAVIDGIRPRGEIEAMLASEMAATHALAMKMLGRARRAEYVDPMERYGNLAVKLLRTFATQTEALAKTRRGGEQTVRVEHVHVYPGGQAVVGNVTHAGGGGAIENGDQPHETEDARAIAFAPGTAVRSEDQGGRAMPQAVHSGKAAVSAPRRRKG